MEVGASGTAGAVEKVSDHGSKIKKWGQRFVEEKELVQEGEQQQTSQGWGALGEAQGGWRRQQIKEKEDGRKGNQAL